MKKQKSIINLIALIFAVIFVLQVLVLLSIVYIGRVPEKLKEESYQNFDMNFNDNVNQINKIMDSRKNFSLFVDQLKQDFTSSFGSLSNMISSSENTKFEYLAKSKEYLISLIEITKADSAFIILEDGSVDIDNISIKEGLYIAYSNDYDKLINTYDAFIYNSNLNLDTDNLNLIQSAEKFSINLADPNNKYYQVLKTSSALQMVGFNPYISVKYQEFLKDKVINISYPFYDAFARLVAVIGIEFSVADFLGYGFENHDITYVLGYSNNLGDKITPVLSWGDNKEVLNTTEIKLDNKMILDNKYYGLEGSSDYAICRKEASFYRYNYNAFSDEEWYLLGVIETNKLVYNSNFITNMVILIIITSLAFGMLMIVLIAKKVAKPIQLLSSQVKNRPTNEYIEFTKTDIEEVNNLVDSFEKLTYDMLQYSSKLKNAINTFLLGIYFCQHEAEEVYCTQAFLDMCGTNLIEGYIFRKDFEEIYNKLTKSYYDEKYEAYKTISDRWVKLETKSESKFILGILTDVTEQIEEVKRIEKELDIDGFTKLYNRIAFQKLATKILENNSNLTIAVIMWDMDNLKYINDRYGHEAGDRYIIKFANILRTLESTNAVVARRSGDEFFAIITGNSKQEIERILDGINQLIDNSQLEISSEISEKIKVSRGVAWYLENGGDLKSLLEYADKELYQAKYEYSTTKILDLDEKPRSINVFHFNQELAKIVDGNFITFAYQPIVDAKTGEIFGYEMLMRIFNDIINTPKKLLDCAIQNGKIDNIEEMTFSKGFEEYNQNFNDLKDKKIFINSISKAKVTDKLLKDNLELFNNSLDMLVVELTNIAYANKDFVQNKINKIKMYNAMIAIDNFCDNFDLSYQNIDFIKIDLSIISNLSKDTHKQGVFKNIIKYAKSNNYKIIAVGIDNQEDFDYIIHSNVDYIQGFYIGEPTVKPIKLKEDVLAMIKAVKEK